MNCASIRRDLLVAMRGKISQSQMSQKLGYQFNQMYRWESGTTKMSWLDFLKFAKNRKVDMSMVLKKSFQYNDKPERYDLFVRHLVGDSKITKIAKINGTTPFRVRRWLNHVFPPDLDDVLSLINHHAHVLLVFLGFLTDVSKITVIREELLKREAEIDLMRKYPVSGAVLRALELDEYQKFSKHQEGWISKKLGISLQDEVTIIERLKSGRLIAKKDHKYHVLSSSFNPQGDIEAGIALRLYWLARTKEFVSHLTSTPSRSTPVGQLVFSCSNEAKEKIVDKYSQFFNEIHTILASDHLPPEQINVLGVQLLDVSKV
jgi:hypothetical protein